jgi:prevent-host-death family protein
MSKTDRAVPAATFKVRCLALLDEVAATRQPLVVTKRGRAVARLVPVDSGEEGSIFGPARGSILYLAPDQELFSTGTEWSATR